MTPVDFRMMTPRERELVDRLLTPAFPGRQGICEQLRDATVRPIDEDGSLEFLVSSAVSLTGVKYAVPTEGEYEDPDGVTVHVLLHVGGDKVTELEFYREDNERVQTWPDPDSVRVFAPP
jgi:hypothetical protein